MDANTTRLYLANSSSTSSTPLDRTTIFVTVFQVITCVLGLILYVLVCQIMLAYRKTTFANPFYTLAIALALPDCVNLVVELICAVPISIIGFQNVPFAFVIVSGFTTTFCYWWLASLMIVIAVNRYVAICHFNSYKILFSPRRVNVIMVSCFGSAFVFPIFMYSCTCRFLFKEDAWKFYCNGSCSEIALTLNAIVSSAYTLAVAFIYTMNFARYKLIRRQLKESAEQRATSTGAVATVAPRQSSGATNNTTTSIVSSSAPGGGDAQKKQLKKECILMLQFSLISLVLILYIGTFWVVSLVWNDRYGNMFLNAFAILNSCVSPMLYLVFSSDFKRRLPWRTLIAQSAVNGNGNG